MKLHSVWLEHWFLRVTGQNSFGFSGAGHFSDTRKGKNTSWFQTILVNKINYDNVQSLQKKKKTIPLRKKTTTLDVEINIQHTRGSVFFPYKSSDVMNSVSMELLFKVTLMFCEDFCRNMLLLAFPRVPSNLLSRAISKLRLRTLSLWENHYLGLKGARSPNFR